MKSFISLFIFSLLFSAGSAFAGDLEDRVASLEERVSALENKQPKPCLSREDGIVPKGIREIQEKNNTWVYGASFKESFSIEVLKKFTTEEGHDLSVVRMYTPGYAQECGIHLFETKNLILF